MTDSQQLFAEYARNGSDAAFRELVTRYVDLVYSTALRLVEGDTHRAEDVAQTVFVDLARRARTLSHEVMPGGWFHRHTCFVAANTLRGERRRQSRERQAVEMNALQTNSGADFSQVAPLLDEAINELGEADRTAILLRFFEQHDFRTVGQALGSNEDAARMRVTRALEKLETLLKRRGVTASSGALAIVLGANAVQAAPVGLAITVSAAAALAGTITTATIATHTTTHWLNIKSITAIVAAALTAGTSTYLAQQREVNRLRSEKQNLFVQQESVISERDDATNKLAALREENQRLNRNTSDLLRLRAETARLQKELRELQSQTASSKRTSESSPLVSPIQSQNAVVFVGGEVHVPGPKVWTQGMKLTDAIRMSEMLTSVADKKASVTDSTGTRNDYDLHDLLRGKAENPSLKPGDRVHVPRSESSLDVDPASEIHVSGAVVLPSHWPWTNGLSLTAAISMVGGLTEYADGRVEVIHRGKGIGNIYNLREIQSGRAQNPVLESGDDIQAQPVRPPPK